MENKLEKVVSLCKRRGFVFQGSEIYGGLSGVWDYGHYGSELAHNIKELWWNHFVRSRKDMFGLSSGILTPEAVFKASGHTEDFADPFRETRFNTMFETKVGAGEEATKGYLRPEIAQGMFVNFKNFLDTMSPELPFGIAQIGKAFRNEISPRDFIFRVREFDLMEFEYFVKENDWEKYFEEWRKEVWSWIESVGIDKTMVSELEVSKDDRAHYSKRTVDFEFEFPFGKKELYGLAYRGGYDLTRHQEHSKIDLRYTDPASGEKFIPHVIEPTFGLSRTMLAVLVSAYSEDEVGGEKRVVLKFNPKMAPVKLAVFPLVRNKENILNKSREVFSELKKKFGSVEFDDNGNIGKRYRRQDEIGTPWCVTVDYQTLEDNTVTIRDRDTGEQIRQGVDGLNDYFAEQLK